MTYYVDRNESFVLCSSSSSYYVWSFVSLLLPFLFRIAALLYVLLRCSVHWVAAHVPVLYRLQVLRYWETTLILSPRLTALQYKRYSRLIVNSIIAFRCCNIIIRMIMIIILSCMQFSKLVERVELKRRLKIKHNIKKSKAKIENLHWQCKINATPPI